MKNHTNFKIGGNADIYVIAKTIEQIQVILKLVKQYQIPLIILGNGSNVLVSDQGIRGIVLSIAIQQFEIEKNREEAIITVGAGEPLGKIAYSLLKEEIAGFEFAGGIPGTIGGAIRMNAGAYGGEMRDCIQTVTYMTEEGEIKEFSNQECEFSYRHSIFCDKNFIIVKAKIVLPYGEKQEIQEKMEEYAQSRKEKQPLMFPSAGSTFKRGADFITAKLIDECSLKGYSVGDAQVSTMHAGFVVNTGNATAKDVIEVVNHVKQIVFEKTGKQIELEIELLGEF
ncbi:MAG: UDP-N-acetylmuramate dehydrogenase [Clostridia bacterium]|nr:UDP-N-acetylmuramate dehydrogenase [Clostridia bacterium]